LATPTNQAVIKAFALLQSFADGQEWLSCAELSRRANLPGASGYRLLQSLEKAGAVVRGARGRYRPGMLLISITKAVEVGEVLREASDEILRTVSAQLGLTVHMGVLEEGMVTYVAKHGHQSRFPVHTEVGAQLEAYCSGLGKVLLASLPDSAIDAFLREGELVALTPRTITDPMEFRAEIAKVRAQNYAIDDCEICLNMRCVAVPVNNASGRTVAAVSASGEASCLAAREQEVRLALAGAAAAITQKLYPVRASA